MVARDGKGRFVKGVSGNPAGRPTLSAETPRIEGIAAACTAEDVAKVLEKMRALALAGNVKAATIYLAYAVGKPVQIDLEDRLSAIEVALGIQRALTSKAITSKGG
ncbi:MAG: DUF5681 domain-containing protein [Chloroflexota bacterium]